MHYFIINFIIYYFIFIDQLNVLVICLTSNYYTSESFTANERQALHGLYNSTNGNDWIYQEGNKGHWDFTDPNVNPCLSNHTWQGLNCTIIDTSTYYISQIILPYYNLTGFIPDSIGSFSYMKYLDLSHNNIYNEIPNTIGNLTELIQLDLSNNSLSGTLPNSIYNLTSLQKLNLGRNYDLKGTISNLIGRLSQLQYLNLRYNKFVETIPYTIGSLSDLTYLRMSFNRFTGSIPDSIRNLTKLTLLYLTDNKINGTIPYWLGDLSSLVYLSLGYNNLIGSIPSSLSKLKHLNDLTLSANQLLSQGTIPYWVGELSNLTYLGFNNIQLNGTISSVISNLTYLNVLDLGNNKLTGSIPHWVGELPLLISFQVLNNQLTGTIPSSLAKLTLLEEIFLFDNLLIGSIPDIFNSLRNLTIIDFQNNHLTGTVPHTIANLLLLRRCFLQYNHLSGNLYNIFNGNNQKYLQNIQLSNNQFTGKLPEQLFLSQSLVSFSAVSNCFHGSIPSSICNNTQLQTLALDGLVCASSCRSKLIPGISSVYVSNNEITGGIPNCLWSMPKLKVLHLSGNSLTGSLPDNIKLSDSLVDLSLSYNMLTGSIPNVIQEREWDDLDLSHNRISGTLRSNYARQSKNGSLSLRNNRLTGFIPKHLQQMRNISILEGNAYTCKYDRSDLPTHDDYKDTYECGSNTFNIIYYLWLGCIVTATFSMLLAYYYREKFDKYLQVISLVRRLWKWINIIEYIHVDYEIETTTKPTLEFIAYLKAYHAIQEIILRFSLCCTLFILLILLPVYIILNTYYSTHTYEYAWTVSILYLTGKVAFGIVISLLLVFIMIQVYNYYYSIYQNTCIQTIDFIEKQINSVNEDKIAEKNASKWKIYSMYLIYVSINLIVVSGVNIGYVYVVLYQSNQIIILVQILLSIFKMVWNNIISPRMIYWIISYLSITSTKNKIVQRRLFVLELVVTLFNNIIIPCLIVAVISPNCFYHAFYEESDVKSSFFYQYCEFTNEYNDCIHYKTTTSTTSYSPPFISNFQCSSEFVTYYASIFALMCLMSTFLVPIINYIILKLSQQYEYISVLHELPKMLNLEKTLDSSSPLLAIDDIYEFLVSILTMVALLLTFGVVFPPLAVLFLLAIYRRIYYHKAIIGRYISFAMECKTYGCLDIINEDCKVVPSLSTLLLCGWVLLYIACMFYPLFVFDILADEVGENKAFWVLILIPCIPICMHIIYKLYINWIDFNVTNQVDEKIDKNIVIDNKNVELSSTLMTSNPLFVSLNSNIIINNSDNL